MVKQSTEINKNSTIELHPEALSVDMDGERVALQITTNEYHGIDAIGTLIWEMIEQQPIRVENLCQQLSEQFPEDNPTIIEQDVIAFLAGCQKADLIQVVH